MRMVLLTSNLRATLPLSLFPFHPILFTIRPIPFTFRLPFTSRLPFSEDIQIPAVQEALAAAGRC